MKAPKFFLLSISHLAVGLMVGVGVWTATKHDASALKDGQNPSNPRSGGIGENGTLQDPDSSRPSAGRAQRSADPSGQAGTSAPTAKSMDDIRRISDPMNRMSALLKLLDTMPAEGFAAFLEEYRSMEHYGDSRREQEMILQAWAKADPAGAIQAATERGSNRDTMTVLAAWAGQDPAAAESWATAHADGDQPNRWMAAVVQGLAAHDLDAASRLAQGMPASRERGWAIESISRALMVQGTEAAMAYPASIPDEHLRASFTSILASHIADRDPSKAAEWVSSADAASQQRSAETVARALVQQDVNAAVSWINKLDPAAKAQAAAQVIPAMANGDHANITKTANWVSGMSSVPNFDRIAEEFVWCCDVRQPEQSAAWIQAVADPQRQERLYHRMLGEWSKRDAGAVNDWVATNAVPKSVTNRFGPKQ